MIASLALADLTTPITVDEARQSIYDVLAIIGVSTTDWRPNAVLRVLITAVAVMIAALSTLIALIASSGFLALAKGAWLTLVARYVYNVYRIEASFATGSVTLTNTGGGVYAYDPDDVTFVAVNGKTYRNTEAIALGALGTQTVAIRADEIGTLSNASPGAITFGVGLPAAITVTNAASVVGRDEELDEDLRTRCSEKLGSLSPNGPADAYGYAARTATRADGSPIGVNRVRTKANGSTGLDVYCATPSGLVPGTAGDINTDLGRVNEAIQTQVVPIPIIATVHSATPIAINITYTAYAYNTAGITSAQAHDYIVEALRALMARQPIGGNRVASTGYLWLSDISGAISSAAAPAGRIPIFRVDLVTPTVDIFMDPGGVPILGTVTGAVNLLPPAGL